MNFNQLAAAAAAANPNNINVSSFTSAVQSLLANTNIDLSQLASLSSLGNTSAAAINAALQPPTSRQNQAHHLSRSANSSLNSGPHLPSSISNLQSADAQATGGALPNLPASLNNLTSTGLADLASVTNQAVAHSGRASIQSAHRSNHQNHHASSSQLTAAHQSTSAGKALLAHQSQNAVHHRHSNSHNTHNPTFNSHSSIINNANNSIMNNNNTINNTIINNSSINNANSSLQIIATNNTSSITPPKSSTCYRVGDCVYYETSPTLPLQIGKIDEICKTRTDELSKTNSGDIEVKVVMFFRRRDISSSLMTLADKYPYDDSQEEELKQMSEEDKDRLKQRELFYSRNIETIPAASIRGKCTVQLLNESETFASYLSKKDQYFYTLVYDPQQKTISADRGEIRVGQRYQAEVNTSPAYAPQTGGDPADPRDLNEMETMVYTPDHDLTDDDINKFLTIAKSVGTFARALDCSSSIKQPSLHLTAASASRDVTLLYAMQLLHQNNYDLGKAVCALVPSTGPVLCRDEIEEWTAGEATLFEEAIEKYGREFGDIRQDFLPWKSVKNIVEYYYMWKTTDRSINQRKMKALEAENKVTVLYITDPENELKKSPNEPVTTNTSSSATDLNNQDSTKTARPLKRPQESDDTNLNSAGVENSNSTLKRRQVTEPKLSAHVACHTTPGENLRFISNKRHKLLRRGLITRKQLRHLSRRPWERRVKSRT